MVTKEDVFDNRHKFLKRIVLIENSDCFTMKGYLDADGYVSFQFRYKGIKKNIIGHRASYIIHNEEAILTNDVIMHSCDNPCCVNPKHLKKGTHDTNNKDRQSKGRCARGINNGRYTHGKYCKY